MSTWIYVTNLPLYSDDLTLKDIFNGIGEMVTTKMNKDELILGATGMVEFCDAKHAKLAASKKDSTVIDKCTIRVYLIWCSLENLSTIRALNIPYNWTITDIEKHFNRFGNIVNIEICNNNIDNNGYALISYSRIDYALQAVQEMDAAIIGLGDALSVQLINPDARNLEWKRHSFEYISLDYMNNNDNDDYNEELYELVTNNINISESPLLLNGEYNRYSIKLIIDGYIRNMKLSDDDIDRMIEYKISLITCNYLESSPLYLRDPNVPAPPQRTPPSPPNDEEEEEEEEEEKEENINDSISSIEGKYQQIFDIYRDRLDFIECKMNILNNEFDVISSRMNTTLIGLEQRRITDINTIQKQFNSTITALCYQINEQINNQIKMIINKLDISRKENKD